MKVSKESRLQAARDLAEQLKLEVKLKRSLKPLYKTIADDFAAEYIKNQSILNVNDYNDELKAILKTHYRKVAKVFKTNLRDKKKALSDIEIASGIDTQITTFIDVKTGYQTDLIISTLDESLGVDVDTVIFEAAADGVQISKYEVAKDVKKKFVEKIDGRLDTIATTETGIMAEQAKLIEADNLVKLGIEKVKKQWVSNLDEVTRIGHIFADGQVQNIQDPFIVGGEQMMTPRDSSLGASLGNIINCRCDTIYVNE